MQPSPDLFAGVRVVELAQWVFVPVAGAMLADWGADVVKIEHPVSGDGYRGLMSQGIGPSGSVNLAIEMANRGKRSVALDIKADAGQLALLRLVEQSDVFLTNFLPSTLERLGLGYERLREVNPGLIYARGLGYGARGADADTPAYDSTAFWARGAMAETLTPQGLPEPIPQRGALGDRNAAAQLAFGIAAALFRRERTGEGALVDVSLLATAMWMITSDVLAAIQGSFHPSAALSRGPDRAYPPNPLTANYRCADGRFMALCCLQADRHWRDVCRALEVPELADDPRFVDSKARSENRAACTDAIAAAFEKRTLEEWKQRFATERFAWAPFQRVTELLDDPQVAANGYVGEVEAPGRPRYSLPTGAVQFDEQAPGLRPAPAHGEHTDEVLLSLGYSWDELIEMKTEGIVL